VRQEDSRKYQNRPATCLSFKLTDGKYTVKQGAIVYDYFWSFQELTNLVHTARGIIRAPPEFNVLISATEALRWSKIAHSIIETNTICFHPYFLNLPRIVQEDILRHELAHLSGLKDRGARRISYEYFRSHPLELTEFITAVDYMAIPIEKKYMQRLRRIYYQKQKPSPKQLSALVYYFFSTFLPAVKQQILGRVAVIMFDMDNTLYDSDELAPKYDEVFIEFVRSRMPSLSVEEIRNMILQEKSHSRICALLNLSVSEYHKYLVENIDLSLYIRPNTELQHVLERISRDYPLVLLTNNCRELAEKTLEYLDIRQYFSLIIAQEDFGPQVEKPHPEAFRIVLRHFNIDSSNAMMVGDSLENDIYPARELGMYAVLVKGDSDLVDALPQYLEFIRNNHHEDGGIASTPQSLLELGFGKGIRGRRLCVDGLCCFLKPTLEGEILRYPELAQK